MRGTARSVGAVMGAEDRGELADLVARYADRADRRDLDGLFALFTEDAVLVLPDPPHQLGPVTTHRGRDEIRAAMSSLTQLPMTFHALQGQVVDPGAEPGTAAGRVSCTANHLTERPDGEMSNLVWHLHYEDSYRREEEMWRFARRAVQIEFIETRPVRRWREQG